MAGYNNSPWYVNPYSYTNTNFPPNVQQNPNIYNQNSEPGEDIKWVQGEAGARSFYVKPGRKQLLMDSESNLFYIKICDASGVPLPLRVFKYEEVTGTFNNNDNNKLEVSNDYVTHEELEAALAKLQTLKKKEERKNEQSFI